ncbi:class I SAM-dependent methyltransferase [Rhodohalobacter sp. SW132]|uniref:class I SAM-dependent methyltransferase n=1 Tax=Rhodohalobacter sp. SW132 TaxID=2293433 RepID=UPI000E23FDFD|nr:class I SAM-dependent methyltransferase [Rhodohalobacter sp. SW132]REL39200.1 class I SAM-dependent methyltransferase [Rhodohalobacter sp. SW132]
MKKVKSKDKFLEITNNQKQTWSKGDFNEIARQNVVMAEKLVSAVDPHPGQKVLDLACGSGTAALVAARRYCDVTGIDYVPELITRARKRAEAGGLSSEFLVADAQDLPFPDNSFDVILSVYGVQFAPNQEKAAAEMLRVCKPGGKIGLASPIPEGWSGDFFTTHGRYVPPPPGVKPPLRWGTEVGLHELLGDTAKSIKSENRKALQYYLSTDHAVEVFSNWFGPTLNALEKINEDQKKDLLRDLKTVFDRYNIADDGTAIVENLYLQSIIFR